jgi:hypothetical protein
MRDKAAKAILPKPINSVGWATRDYDMIESLEIVPHFARRSLPNSLGWGYRETALYRATAKLTLSLENRLGRGLSRVSPQDQPGSSCP